MNKKTIVISAVNLVEAGTLAILRECLSYLSRLASEGEFRVVAIVFDKELVRFPYIEYIENRWPKKRWINRLWFEYYTMNRISKELNPVYLWFSLHDTTPTVKAKIRAVYCHNSYFSYNWKLHDLLFAPKIALFAIFTKLIYKTNITFNDYLVVQQVWFRNAMNEIFHIDKRKIIVARPETHTIENKTDQDFESSTYSFVYAGSPNSHKNFEVICKAVELLEAKLGQMSFNVIITVKGNENRYAAWLWKKWGHLKNLEFRGFVSSQELFSIYRNSSCLIYPSKVESWGLPISEFASFRKPMLLADLPYAHETAEGSELTAFFNPNNAIELACQMEMLIHEKESFLKKIPINKVENPSVTDWEDLFTILLK